MQAIYRLLFSQNCNCYPHLYTKDVPQLKFTTFSDFHLKNLLLPCFHHISIHCSVFKVQVPIIETGCKRPNCFRYLHLLSMFLFGGDSRDRTGDLLLARQALSQLSYIPIPSSLKEKWWARVGSNHRPYDYQSYALAS